MQKNMLHLLSTSLVAAIGLARSRHLRKAIAALTFGPYTSVFVHVAGSSGRGAYEEGHICVRIRMYPGSVGTYLRPPAKKRG